MKRFSGAVFDDTLYGTAAVYTSARWNEALGLGDKLTLQAVVDEVSAGGDLLTVQIEQSADAIHWSNKAATPEIDSQAVLANQTTYLNAYESGDLPSLGFVRLRISLRSGGASAHLKLFVTARDT